MSLLDILTFNFLATHLVFVGIYLILALSLNLINGSAGMFSLGHQGFWAVGAYGAGALIVHFPYQIPGFELFGMAVPVQGIVVFCLSFGAGVILATLSGLVIGVPCLRLRGDYLAIATLGFAEIIRILLNNFEWVGASRGLRIPYQIIEKTPDTATGFFVFFLVVTGFFVALTIVICRNLIHSSHGRAILSLREDEVASELVGVDITRYKVLTFLLGAGFAGLAGAIHANFFGIISPKDFSLMPGILILLMVVLGGSGSMSGTVLATILLYSVQQVLKLRLFGLPTSLAGALGWEPLSNLARAVEELSVNRWQVLFALLLIVVMIAAPQGLFGKREISDTRLYRKLFPRGGRRGPAEGSDREPGGDHV